MPPSLVSPLDKPAIPEIPTSQRSFTLVLILVLISSAIYLGNAFTPALLDDADSSHAVVAREMLNSGDWTILHMNGIRWTKKAPLHYWWVALDFQLMGQSELATRLPVALSMIGLTIMIFLFGRDFYSPRAGWIGAIIMSTCFGSFIFTRIMIPEAIYALEFAAGFYFFLLGWSGRIRFRNGVVLFAVFAALSVLTRGLIGVIFPFGVVFFFTWYRRSWKRWLDPSLLWAVLVFSVIAVPWHVIAAMRDPGFFWSYFINEHFLRAIGKRYPQDYSAAPLWLWWLAHLLWFFPWSAFIFSAGRRIRENWRQHGLDDATLLLAIWAGFVFVFFSATTGSRMEYYAFGAWPAIALLIGRGISLAEDHPSRSYIRSYAVLAAIGVVFAIALTVLALGMGAATTGDITKSLETHPNDFYRLSMAHMFDLRGESFAYLRGPALTAAFAFGVGLLSAYFFKRRKKSHQALLTVALTMVMFAFAANSAFAVFQPQMSSYGLWQAISSRLQPSDKIVFYGEFDASSSVSFYSGKQVLIFNGRYNNLEFGSNYPDAPKVFLNDQDFYILWKGEQRVFLVVPEDKNPEAAARLPKEDSYLLACSGGKAVYTNQQFEGTLGAAAASPCK